MSRNRRNMALFSLIYFCGGMCFYGPVATLYRQAVGLSVFDITVIESISVAAMLLLEIPWGWLADRLGHRRTIWARGPVRWAGPCFILVPPCGAATRWWKVRKDSAALCPGTQRLQPSVDKKKP